MYKTQLKNKEGCRLKGNFFVDAVPGSFIISGKAFYPTIKIWIKKFGKRHRKFW